LNGLLALLEGKVLSLVLADSVFGTDGALVLLDQVEDSRLDDGLLPLEVFIGVEDDVVVHVPVADMAIEGVERAISDSVGIDFEDEFFEERGGETDVVFEHDSHFTLGLGQAISDPPEFLVLGLILIEHTIQTDAEI
jgi:hypothetical protein